MSESATQEQLNDLCLRALVRTLQKQASPLTTTSPVLDSADLHAVRLYWALSDWVKHLAERVVERPREAQEVLEHEVLITEGEITGTVDARATLLEQERTGNPVLFVVEEPNATLFSGPNHVVAWSLAEAHSLIRWAERRAAGARSPEWLSERAKLLEDALRTHALREVMASPLARNRPRAAALRAASKSRLPLYRMATIAFRSLQDAESLNSERLREMFAQTLVSSMEDWRKLELAAALSAAEAISEATGHPADMDLLFEPGRPLARIGNFAVRWQYSQPRRPDAWLDPSEALTKTLTSSLGLSQAAGRVDAGVFHVAHTEPLAFIECKWFESDSSRVDALFDACAQLVGYARDAHPDDIGTATDLLRRSLVIVASRGDVARRLDGLGPVNCGDLSDLQDGALTTWASSIMSYCAALALAA